MAHVLPVFLSAAMTTMAAVDRELPGVECMGAHQSQGHEGEWP